MCPTLSKMLILHKFAKIHKLTIVKIIVKNFEVKLKTTNSRCLQMLNLIATK